MATVLLPLATLAACGGSSEVERITITGSSTVAPLVNEIARRYERLHDNLRIDVQTGGSSRGIHDARAGLADIGMVSRALKAGEADLHGHAIARDGIAIVVHAENPVAELQPGQIRAIYRGEIDNWQAVGGRDAPITVINKAEGRSTLELFLKHFGLDNPDIDADVVIGDNEQGIKTLLGNPEAIGYVSIGAAESAVQRGQPLRLLPLEGVAASTAAVREGRYPLSRQLLLVTRAEPEGAVAELIRFATSAEVNDLVRQQFFVPLQATTAAR